MAQPTSGPMAPSSLDVLLDELKLDVKQRTLLHATGARNPEELYALFLTFPSIAVAGGLDVAEITNHLAMRGGESFSSFLAEAQALAEEGFPQFALGAAPPEDAAWTHGTSIPMPAVGLIAQAVQVPAGVDTLDLRRCLPWPVRNQGQRGTCVSFAVTALREALDCELGLGITDLSEQLFYWAIKRTPGEPFPGKDGTLIDFAVRALRADGICPEPDWPYNSVPIPGNPGQGGPGLPSPAAIANAPPRRHPAAVYQRGTGAGNAARLVALLRGDRPAAISLPVFSDPLVPPGQNNWTTPLGRQYGWVAEPQPTSVVSGGHAVCITGFAADPTAPGGGWFVIRNSWGSALWGRALPHGGYVAPEAGYGQVSWQYVDRFLWEVCQL